MRVEYFAAVAVGFGRYSSRSWLEQRPHLNPIKQDAGNEHQISDKQDRETALDMWDCEMRVMNDGSDTAITTEMKKVI